MEYAYTRLSAIGSKCSQCQCKQCSRSIHCLTCSDLLSSLSTLGSWFICIYPGALESHLHLLESFLYTWIIHHTYT
jgi:hypothetical protein